MQGINRSFVFVGSIFVRHGRMGGADSRPLRRRGKRGVEARADALAASAAFADAFKDMTAADVVFPAE